MRSYLVRRLLAIVPTLLAVSVVIFLLLHSAPGGPMAVYANNPNVDPADLARLEASLGLHDPYPVQYVKWLGAMLTGNWGISYKYARPVGGILGERLARHAAARARLAGDRERGGHSRRGPRRDHATGAAAPDRQHHHARRVGPDVLAGHRRAARLLGEAARPAVGRHGHDRRRLRPGRSPVARRRSRRRARDARDRRLEPLSPVHAAGGDGAGLYPHRARQGAQRGRRGPAPWPAQCPPAAHHAPRPAGRAPGRRAR